MSEPNSKLNAMDKILSYKDKGQKETEASAGGILSRMWRQVLYDLNIGPLAWRDRVNIYMSKSKKNNNSDKISMRGTINKELAERNMTFKTLIKGFKILGAVKFKISIKVTWENRSESTHVLNVNLLPTEQIERVFKENDERYYKENEAKNEICDNLQTILEAKNK